MSSPLAANNSDAFSGGVLPSAWSGILGSTVCVMQVSSASFDIFVKQITRCTTLSTNPFAAEGSIGLFSKFISGLRTASSLRNAFAGFPWPHTSRSSIGDSRMEKSMSFLLARGHEHIPVSVSTITSTGDSLAAFSPDNEAIVCTHHWYGAIRGCCSVMPAPTSFSDAVVEATATRQAC